MYNKREIKKQMLEIKNKNYTVSTSGGWSTVWSLIKSSRQTQNVIMNIFRLLFKTVK